MEIILLEKIKNVGNLGDVVRVKNGYARNYLIPQKKALFATKNTIAEFETRRADLEKKANQVIAQAEQRAAKLNDTTIVIFALASDEGKLFGSVGAAEIQDALAEKSIEVSKREIVLIEGPMHSTGDFTVEIHLHSDVIAKLQVQIQAAKK